MTGEDADEPSVAARVRGIYSTALTRLLREAGHEVVQASAPIRERFDAAFAVDPATVAVGTSRDRRGVGVSGDPAAVDRVATALESVGIDAFRWRDGTPRGAVFDAEVVETPGRGAVVDLGDGRRGWLPYDAVDGYVDEGNRYRVQVHEPAPPWDDDRPLVRPTLEVQAGLLTLSQGRDGVTAATGGERATELVGMTDLLSATAPEGWGLRWGRIAADADVAAMDVALERAAERAGELEDAIASADAATGVDADAATGVDADAATGVDAATDADADDRGHDGTPGEPRRLVAPVAAEWLWFGRESRLALDGRRRAVETTMVGHHRIKAADESASAAVDFAEAVCDDAGADGADAFPFAAVARQFGPREGDRLELGHGKPDGRLVSLGTGEVTDWDPDGSITLERSMRGGGTYDALGVPKEAGDVAVTKLKEGRWWYPTTYRSADGGTKGTYVNVCTPVELFPDCARYVDLYVDVIKLPDGTVAVVDEDDLAESVEKGLVSEELAEKARSVASAVERALSS